ncbi:S8 family peptidase [Microbulbifer sp. 2201CG32-9]|uniref:S8 family peptidase n=1 Tax=Microbulbifer sp. 2201CG32-9 TaxID=3232309 RepID=UPI00345C507A
MGAEVVRLDKKLPDEAVENLAKAIAKVDSSIEYAEADTLMQPAFVPNDARYNEQWHYFESTGGIRAPSAWNKSTGSGVNIAVIDTGYRPHADLTANILPGYDFIHDPNVSLDGDGRDGDAIDPGDGCSGRADSWHGTHVAGTIAAKTNNSIGVAGVAFDAKIVPARTLGCGGGYISDIADAITWTSGGNVPGVPTNANVAKVLNLSLSGSGACGETYQKAINGATDRGSVVVVSAGNQNTDASTRRPANCDGVITVAATDRAGNRAYYSNFGNTVEIAAPGGETSGNKSNQNGVLSTLNTGVTSPGSDTYAFYEGTSMAAPHIAGVAALMLSVQPKATPEQISIVLQETARIAPGTCNGCGAGIVDAAAAVNAMDDLLVGLYRYWNSAIGDHTLTIDRNDNLYAFLGYSLEKIEAYVSSKPRSGFVPLNRYWNATLGDSFLTITRNDPGFAAFGYEFVTEEGYVSSNSRSGFAPLNRYWNPDLGDHFLTILRDDYALGIFGYTFERIEGYAQSEPY